MHDPGVTRRNTAGCQPFLQIGSVGSFLPVQMLASGTRFPSPHIEAISGKFPSEPMMTIRCGNQAEANHVSASIKLSPRPQSKNGRVFSQGEEDGFENKAEKRCDTLSLHNQPGGHQSPARLPPRQSDVLVTTN